MREPIGCTETSIRNYHYSLCNNPEERSFQLLRGGSLKIRLVVRQLQTFWESLMVNYIAEEAWNLTYIVTYNINKNGYKSISYN
jgi:hypothetical protein